jgi:hypothetical protein
VRHREGASVDSERFDGLARTVGDRGAERDRDRDQFEALTRLVATKGSRRLALAGLMEAVLLGQEAHSTDARCRSKEGKNTRQCRRRERKGKAPGGYFDCQQDQLFGLCFIFGPAPCCNGMTCASTITPFVTACQLPCATDDDCKKKFPNKALACRLDALVCPLRDKCCVPR